MRKEIQRYASIGFLTAGVLHDINTPLSTVLANLEIISSEQPKLNKYTKRMYQAVQQINQIIDDVRIQIQGNDIQETFNSAEIITEVISSLRKAHSQWDLDIFDHQITGSHSAFYRILNNLLINAIESTTNEPEIYIRQEINNTNYILDISDKGSGFGVCKLDSQNQIRSSKQAHFGLGLKITTTLIENCFSGSLSSIKPYDGFNTTMRLIIPQTN